MSLRRGKTIGSVVCKDVGDGVRACVFICLFVSARGGTGTFDEMGTRMI